VTRGRRLPHLFFAAGMILPAAFLYLVVSGQPHVFILVVVGLGISAFHRKEIPYNDRSIIYSVLLALVLAALLDMAFPIRRDKMMFGRLFASNISVPFVLYMAVLSTFFESSPYTLGFAAAASLMGIMMGGDYRPFFGDSSGGFDAFPIFSYLRERFDSFFIVVASIEMLALIAAFLHGRRTFMHRRVSPSSEWLKRLVFAMALILSAAMTASALIAVRVYKNQIRNWETYLGNLRPRVAPGQTKVFFGNEIDLNTSIRANRSANRNVILLRAVGDNPPGYLRGRVYQYYSKGHWRVSLNAPMKETAGVGNVEGLALNAFDLRPPKTDRKLEMTLEIYPTASNMANFLFLPGNAERVEIVADKLAYSSDGFFRPKGWESDGGYTVRFQDYKMGAAFPKPTTPDILFYLYTPKELIPVLDHILDEIFGGENLVQRYSEKEKVAMVVDYFRKRFAYTLKPAPPPPGEDPLRSFLLKNHAGHCELFASSAALLLRRLGMPTRYIAGFLCQEAHPSGKYYVARMRDAHAWLEAYSTEERRWVLVDPTPPSEASSAQGGGWGFWEAWTDRLKQAFAEAFAAARRGYVARAVLSLITGLGGAVWDALKTLPGVLSSLAILALFVFSRFRRRSRNTAFPGVFHLSKDLSRLRRGILRLERRVAKVSGVRRGESETMLEWLSKLEAAGCDAASLERLRKLIGEYNDLRFSSAANTSDPAELLLEIKRFRLASG